MNFKSKGIIRRRILTTSVNVDITFNHKVYRNIEINNIAGLVTEEELKSYIIYNLNSIIKEPVQATSKEDISIKFNHVEKFSRSYLIQPQSIVNIFPFIKEEKVV